MIIDEIYLAEEIPEIGELMLASFPPLNFFNDFDCNSWYIYFSPFLEKNQSKFILKGGLVNSMMEQGLVGVSTEKSCIREDVVSVNLFSTITVKIFKIWSAYQIRNTILQTISKH